MQKTETSTSDQNETRVSQERPKFKTIKELFESMPLGLNRTAAEGLDTVIQFHLSGTVPKAMTDSPARVMLDFVRKWGKERGNRWFHLGGGLGARRDSLFEFKAGFSEARAEFRTLRLICDPPQMAAAIRRWSRVFGSVPTNGSFPPYRQGL